MVPRRDISSVTEYDLKRVANHVSEKRYNAKYVSVAISCCLFLSLFDLQNDLLCCVGHKTPLVCCTRVGAVKSRETSTGLESFFSKSLGKIPRQQRQRECILCCPQTWVNIVDVIWVRNSTLHDWNIKRMFWDLLLCICHCNRGTSLGARQLIAGLDGNGTYGIGTELHGSGMAACGNGQECGWKTSPRSTLDSTDSPTRLLCQLCSCLPRCLCISCTRSSLLQFLLCFIAELSSYGFAAVRISYIKVGASVSNSVCGKRLCVKYLQVQ